MFLIAVDNLSLLSLGLALGGNDQPQKPSLFVSFAIPSINKSTLIIVKSTMRHTYF